MIPSPSRVRFRRTLSSPQQPLQPAASRLEPSTPRLNRADSEPDPSTLRRLVRTWSRGGLHIQTYATELPRGRRLSVRERVLPGLSIEADAIVIERCSHTHEYHYVVTTTPVFRTLCFLAVLICCVKEGAGLQIMAGPTAAPMRQRTAPQTPRMMFAAPAAALQHISAFSHLATPRSSPAVLAIQEAGACTDEECFVSTLLRASGGLPVPQPPSWAAPVARLVRGDLLRLASAMQAIHDDVCTAGDPGQPWGASVCTTFDVLGAAALHLDEWGKARAPILHWASARCMRAVVVDAVDVAALGPPPSLGDCLMPLAREAAPLLARCLVSSPWRVCRLAFRYLAFHMTFQLSGVFATLGGSVDAWQLRREAFLDRLLVEVNQALDEGWERHQAAIASGREVGARGRDCVRYAAAALGGVGPAVGALLPTLSACCKPSFWRKARC